MRGASLTDKKCGDNDLIKVDNYVLILLKPKGK